VSHIRSVPDLSDDDDPSSSSRVLRDLASATAEAALARTFAPWHQGRPDRRHPTDPGPAFGRILAWLEGQPAPAGPDAAAHMVRTYVRGFHRLRPAMALEEILQGIERSVREPAPDIDRIAALYRQGRAA
jgi:hypothetical protein